MNDDDDDDVVYLHTGVRQTMQNVIMRCGKQDSGRFFNYDGSELAF